MVLVARARVDLGEGALNGDLGLMLAAHMKASVEMEMTGGLIWLDGYFLEVLEGDREVLRRFFLALAADPRISDLRSEEFLPIARRQYMRWSVGRGDTAIYDTSALRALHDGHASAAQASGLVTQCLRSSTLAESPPLAAA
jgi:hypothetical protein